MAKAQTKTEQSYKTKADLKKNLKQVKKLAQQPGVKNSLREELARLEDNILKVAAMEKQILSKEDMDIRDLKFQIRDLKTRLALTGAEGLKPSLDRITYLLGELTARIDTYTKIKTDREVRMEELEKKIKAKMDENFKEIIQIEKTLANLEKRYANIKKTGDANKATLQKIEEKISDLRNKLIEKRGEIVHKKMAEVNQREVDKIERKLGQFGQLPVKSPPHLPARPIPPPKFMNLPEPEVKHKMMFPSAPPPPTFKKEPDFLPPPLPKKKGFMGWLKRLFGK
ncbi:MAG: hypothetical protein KAT77_03015 [Nanoarchaeota archaeon]|nr:hypothetical protein [Nanoarchaeota archaeon]